MGRAPRQRQRAREPSRTRETPLKDRDPRAETPATVGPKDTMADAYDYARVLFVDAMAEKARALQDGRRAVQPRAPTLDLSTGC